GDVYVTGNTTSTNFPGTTGGAQAANGGGNDAFVARLNASLTTLTQATYLGGSGDENGIALSIHRTSGDVYVAGFTTSTNFPGTTGGAQAASAGGGDAFVARLNSSLTTLAQATYLGGSGLDLALALAIHPTSGDVYVGGYTNSTNFPGTTGGAQAANAGGYDAFIALLSADLSRVGPPATLTLAPKVATNTVGVQHCVTATVKDAAGNPVPSITVVFSVPTAVATHASPSSGSVTTDVNGQATFCYSAS